MFGQNVTKRKRGIAGGIDPMEAKLEEMMARETQLKIPSKILPFNGTTAN